MIIAIASGKGGTGKTTLAVNLATVIGNDTLLVDCDVEEPNCHLFLGGEIKQSDESHVLVPEIDANLCNACGECSRFCQYNAIAAIKPTPLIFPELCHSCGGCVLVCPTKAIREVERRIGTVETVEAGKIALVYGRIDVGVAMVPPLIKDVKSRIKDHPTVIIDAPPGTSCPVIAALKGTDYIILITEPTPFGLNDLKLAVDMVRELKIPFGVVINRVGVGDDRVHSFCNHKKIPILLEIPDDRKIAEVYSRGELVVDAIPEIRWLFGGLMEKIKSLVIKNEHKKI